MADSSLIPPAVPEKPQLTADQIQALLDQTDWTGYWKDVSDRVTEGVEKYEKARALSLEFDSHRVFV